MFGQAICFGVGAIFGDCSDNEDGSGNKRKAVILIKVILMFFVVTGAITTAAVITTMQNKPQEDKMDLITTTENDLTASLSTTLKTTVTEVNFTETSSPLFSSSTTITTYTTTVTTTTKPDIFCEFLEYLLDYDQVNKSLFLDAVLITGSERSPKNTAELYVPSTNNSCSLPQLPDDRDHHTLESSGLLCGGTIDNFGNSNCLQWSSDTGTWEHLLTLDDVRHSHVSWIPRPGIGIYLIGGHSEMPLTPRTTTLIRPDGTQEPGFPLKHDTL